ncbi:MAG: hypothetical protein RIR18_161 [Pseudomonadota bacterium]|jgi:hypothetical protein
MSDVLVSKILVLDEELGHLNEFREFCLANNLVALKVKKHRLMSVLRSNIDLGAILYSETYGGSPAENAEIAYRINSIRPELPIILRRELGSLPENPLATRHIFCATYTADDLPSLKKAIDDYIFSLYYPCDLVRGIAEMTESAFNSQFKGMTLRGETPYIVRDRVIFGEVFSLIPLESAWCRGYMMIQTEEAPLLDVLNHRGQRQEPVGFREVNNLLSEVTNLIWGAFKNRYIGDTAASNQHIQVPLIINHKHKYISFGTENPQLCFFYLLTDEESGESIKVYQRFIFNLSWSPEDFKEILHDSTALVEAGELELF